MEKQMNKAGTAHNRSVCASPPLAARSAFWLGQSLRSFPSLIAAHFASPGLCFAKPLSGLAKHRKQPERYAPFFQRFYQIMEKIFLGVKRCCIKI
jgi:hypothetical protein